MPTSLCPPVSFQEWRFLMYRIALCDDNSQELQCTTKMLSAYQDLHPEQPLDVSLFQSSLECSLVAERQGFDIILLDIYMPGLTGIELANQLRAQQNPAQLIFLTSSRDFAIEAISLNATHYLVKPYTREQLFTAMDRAISQLEQHARYITPFKTTNRALYSVDVRTILCIESYGHSQEITCSDHSFEVRATQEQVLAQLQQACGDNRFIPVYKGIIINQDFIQQIATDYLLLKNGKKVPIVKKNSAVIREVYLDYLCRD